MTTSEHLDPTIADLLKQLQIMQTQVTTQQDALQHQNRAMQHLNLAMQQLQALIAPQVQSGPDVPPQGGTPMRIPDSRTEQTKRDVTTGRGFRRRMTGPLHEALAARGMRMCMKISFAFLLLLAPGGSEVTHADGTGNTRYGDGALPMTTTGNDNAAFGTSALFSNTTGRYNSASGFVALNANTTGIGNTASGYRALYSNTTGGDNTATGTNALYANTTGDFNTASGINALGSNTTGSNNTAVGTDAGRSDTQANANTTGSNNTFIGYLSGPGTSSEITNATAIGANALVSQSNTIVLGGTGANTQRVGVGTTTPHSALQIAKGFLQIRPITGSEPAAAQCATADDAGRLVVRTDGPINLYVCNGTAWIGK